MIPIDFSRGLAAVCAIAAGVLALPGARAETADRWQPAAPAQILDLMPAVPVDWKLEKSIGKLDMTVSAHPYSQATRTYTIPADEKKDLPSATVTVTLIDAISDKQLGSGFALPSKAPGGQGREKGVVTFGDNRFRLRANTRGERRLTALAGDRIGLSILTNVKDEELNRLRSWLETISLSELEKGAQSLVRKKITGHMISCAFIDELRPSRNRTYEMGFLPDVLQPPPESHE